jgi:stage II sporulation protein P
MQTLLRGELGTAAAQLQPAAVAVWTAEAVETAAETAPEPSETVEPAAPAEETPESEPESTPLTFTADQADLIGLENETGYDVDVEALLTVPLDLDLTVDGPLVLIVHTHTAEAYTPSAGWEYEPSDTLRTLDEDCNMLRVGDEIAEALEAGGVAVLHDRTYHDYPAYNGAYSRALTTIQAYLDQYPSIQMVLDVHRDAAENSDGTLAAPTVTVDGQTMAQVMLVVGTDDGGLEHPDWRGNLSCALKLQVLLEQAAPGLCRDLDLRQERFNQHMTPASLLVEVGSAGNTMDQVLPAARLLGQTLAELLAT